MSLNDKLEEHRECASNEVGLEIKVAKLVKVVEVLLEHAPERAKDEVNQILGE